MVDHRIVRNFKLSRTVRFFYMILTNEYFVKIDDLSLIELIGITCQSILSTIRLLRAIYSHFDNQSKR
ncbi:MAG: hypothetical protein ACI88A_005130 [Paraglaciecola sp.]|jgi:hypothetical protein